jgi:hypothetical protein
MRQHNYFMNNLFPSFKFQTLRFSRNLLITLLVFLITSLNAFAVPISGDVADNTVLLSGEVYQSEGDVVVPIGVTLTIEAGVRIEFGSGHDLQVYGELALQGTAANPVVFTSGQAAPARGDWGSIQLYNTQVVHNWSHVVIEYAKSNGPALLVDDGVTLNLSQCVLRHNRDSILFDPGSGGRVEGCQIENSSARGISIKGHSSGSVETSPLIKDNQISGNGTGIGLSGLSTSLIEGNQIEGNAYGIYTGGSNNANYHDPMPRVNGNNFENNSSYAYQARNYLNPSTTALDATGNWWGVSSINQINTVLYDYNDSRGSPYIDYRGRLDDVVGSGNVATGNYLFGAFVPETVLSAGVTYTSLGDIFVPIGETLTIEAGARIELVLIMIFGFTVN